MHMQYHRQTFTLTTHNSITTPLTCHLRHGRMHMHGRETRDSNALHLHTRGTLKRPHRRATVDTSCLARPRPRMKRRLSLPPPRSVRFAERSQVCVFRAGAPAPAAAWWYTRADQERFKRERVADVFAFRERAGGGDASPPAAPPACCPVGVEQFLSAAALREAHCDKRHVILGVLREQRRQREAGSRDPERLASLSVALSATAARWAWKRGKFQAMARFVE